MYRKRKIEEYNKQQQSERTGSDVRVVWSHNKTKQYMKHNTTQHMKMKTNRGRKRGHYPGQRRWRAGGK
jgi:hypothetical protein